MHQPSEGANGTNVNSNIASVSANPTPASPTPPPHRVRPETSGYNVLCFDGGGCRGYASLLTLRNILRRLEPEPTVPVFPYIYFDLICGTSTGGLIAILLGVLHLDIDTAIKVYAVFGKTVFGARWSTFRYLVQDEKFNRSRLRRAVAQILETYAGGRTLMEDSSLDRGCKCFVTVAQRNGTTTQVQLVRSYRLPTEEDSIPHGHQWTIMDAAMSTAAAPTYFRSHRITVDGHHFFFEDAGAHGANNPTTRAWNEIKSNCRFINGAGPNCFVSIGTGTRGIPMGSRNRGNHSGVRRVLDNIANIRVRAHELTSGLVQEVTGVDGVEETMRNFVLETTTSYYRFNPPQIGRIPLDDYKAVPMIQSTMRQYHIDPDINRQLHECSEKIDLQASPLVAEKPSQTPRLVRAWRALTGSAENSIALPLLISDKGRSTELVHFGHKEDTGGLIQQDYILNNPAWETTKEAYETFGQSKLVACMLSLGCGQRPTARLSQKNEVAVAGLVNDIASDSELVDRDLAWRIGKSNVYYRLSVNRILESGGDSTLVSAGEFLEHSTTAEKANQCTGWQNGLPLGSSFGLAIHQLLPPLP